ncbi:MAG TPA: SMP-30/gluconolactonase/LRE family protein [Acetobacteraceae bacterium]|nr:SMP-30/gluconolactonase/LRE family protein [Acetobacteraceae bacterium]
MTEIVCVLDAGAELGEGTFWDAQAQRLWWVDIWGRAIHCFDPATGEDVVYPTPRDIGCVAPRRAGGLVVTLADGFHVFDPATGEFTPIGDPEADRPETRFNDGKTDRQGRFWSGTVFEAPPRPAEPVGALYRLDPDLSCHRMVDGIISSNGLAFSPDSRTLYFADSQGGFVWAFDFDAATGDLANRRVFVDFRDSDGCADGATVDAEGCYWSTWPESGKVCRFDPDGSLMQSIHLPTSIPTCCEFGGPALDILYVTTARLRKLTTSPAGALFAIDAGVRGLALPPFAG